MKIKFTQDGPLEFKTGEWHAKNDGNAIEVDSPAFAAELIATGFFEKVDVIPASAQDKAAGGKAKQK